MYHYTPDPILLKRLRKCRKKGRFTNDSVNSSYDFELAKSLFKDYWTAITFMVYWERADFYSEHLYNL